MTLSVDLNADMGESFGPWPMGDDTALLGVITSANIACGYHAGDADTMATTMTRALENNVGLGAHPGFLDLQGFGRRRMHVPHGTLGNWVRYQLGAAQAMARAAGGSIGHLKLHGALSNMASEDYAMAKTCYQAALDVDPDIVIMVLSATVQEQAVRDLGCAYAAEIFADRAYNDDATLVDRGKPGAVIHDADLAAQRISKMVTSQAIIAESGKTIPARIDTICVHGDNKAAVALARAVRDGLEADGVSVRRFA